MYLSQLLLNLQMIIDGKFENLVKINETEKLSNCLVYVNDTHITHLNQIPYEISAIICTEENLDYYKQFKNIGLVISPDPQATFFEIMNYLSQHTPFYYEQASTIISPKAMIDNNVYIHPTDVIIADDVKIKYGSVINKGSHIKKGCYIGENCIIGAESFSYYGKAKRKVLSSKQVIIDENVDLLGGNIIEKGVHRNTYVGKNTKIAVGSVIEHDVIIEHDNMICANATITGRVKLEPNCYLGPNSTIRNNITLAERTIVSMGSVVTQSTTHAGRITGNFAINHEQFIKKMKVYDNETNN